METIDTTVVNNDKNTKKSSTKRKWSIKKKIAVIAGAIVAFIVAIIIFANVATDAPLKVSDEFVSDIQSSKAAAAYDMMSADAQIATSSQDFASMVDNMGPTLTGKPGMQSKEVNAEAGSDTTAKVVYKITGSDNFTHIITVNLVQSNGDWKVLNFESVKQ